MAEKTIRFMVCLSLIAMLIGCKFGQKIAGTKDNLIIEEPKNSIASSEKPASPSLKKIALVMKTLTNPFFIEMEKGARKAEKDFKINLIVKTGAKETSIKQQISIVEDLIKSKVDAIVIAPGSSFELIPVLKEAQDAKITIVNIDNRLDPALSKKIGLVNVPLISCDNESGAYQSAKYLCSLISIPTEAAILEGIRGSTNSENRKIGALRAFKENKNITVVAQETANWKIDEASVVAAKIFNQHPSVRAVFCANDMMALGFVHYLERNKQKKVLVAGFDNLNEARHAIQTGKMQVTIDQHADIQGYLGIKYAVQMLAGKRVPAVTLVKVKVITAQNAD